MFPCMCASLSGIGFNLGSAEPELPQFGLIFGPCVMFIVNSPKLVEYVRINA
jgi:hypothetical protein